MCVSVTIDKKRKYRKAFKTANVTAIKMVEEKRTARLQYPHSKGGDSFFCTLLLHLMDANA
jgi:hypothetical protein